VSKKDTLNPLIEELRCWPDVDWDVIPKGSGKHPKLAVFFGAQRRKMPVALTPSDRRTALNSVSDLRKMLREIGARRA
jgi:hypothetical protein